MSRSLFWPSSSDCTGNLHFNGSSCSMSPASEWKLSWNHGWLLPNDLLRTGKKERTNEKTTGSYTHKHKNTKSWHGYKSSGLKHMFILLDTFNHHSIKIEDHSLRIIWHDRKTTRNCADYHFSEIRSNVDYIEQKYFMSLLCEWSNIHRELTFLAGISFV